MINKTYFSPFVSSSFFYLLPHRHITRYLALTLALGLVSLFYVQCLLMSFTVVSLSILGQLRVPSDSNNSLRWTQEQCFSQFAQVQNHLPVALTPEGHLNEYKTFSSLFISLDVFVLPCKLLQKRTQWASFYPFLVFPDALQVLSLTPRPCFKHIFQFHYFGFLLSNSHVDCLLLLIYIYFSLYNFFILIKFEARIIGNILILLLPWFTDFLIFFPICLMIWAFFCCSSLSLSLSLCLIYLYLHPFTLMDTA